MIERQFVLHLLALLVAVLSTAHAHAQIGAERIDTREESLGNASITATFKGREIKVTTTSRLAGAIHSLKWKGREFIDSFDHGRQLQSAASFDCGLSREFWAECYNPTEAGSRADGAGPTSTSRLLELAAKGNRLSTRSQMAFWLAPGERSEGRLALNNQVLSNHVLEKRVHIGALSIDNVIQYEATFHVPSEEQHTHAQFEALTGYMPHEFSEFWRLPKGGDKLQPLDDGPGEQPDPVVFSTPDHQFAMGVYSPMQPSKSFENLGYGRFRFPGEKVVKWNCVFRISDGAGIAAKNYTFTMYIAIGDLQDVSDALVTVRKRFSEPSDAFSP